MECTSLENTALISGAKCTNIHFNHTLHECMKHVLLSSKIAKYLFLQQLLLSWQLYVLDCNFQAKNLCTLALNIINDSASLQSKEFQRFMNNCITPYSETMPPNS